MTEHPDVYRGIHKALRRRLFQLCLQAGTLDGAEAYQREALAHAWESLVASLRAHTLHEERFLHPLLSREPGLRTTLEEGHEAHEQALAVLEQLLARLCSTAQEASARALAHDFYRALCAFTGDYLVHLEAEEGEARAALARHCTPAEVEHVQRLLLEAMSEQERTRDLLDMLDAASPPEAAALLRVVAEGGKA